jgi:signal transduction histidine kinase
VHIHFWKIMITINYFIPEHIRQKPDHYRRARFGVVSSITHGCIVLLFFAPFTWFFLHHWFIPLVMIFGGVMECGTVLLFRRTGNLSFLAYGAGSGGMIVVVTAAAFSGTNAIFYLVPLILCTLSPVMIAGPKQGTIWIILNSVVVLVFLALVMSGSQFPDAGLPQRYVPAMFSSVLLFVILAVGLNGRLFESLRLKSQRALEESNHRLVEANEELMAANLEIQQKQDLLQVANAQLLMVNNEKDMLMNIVAHDLKNPISVVLMYAEHIETGEFTGNDAALAIRQIRQTSDKMLELVKNLLDINRLEAGGVQMNMVAIDIVPVLESIKQQYLSQAAAKDIALHFSNEAKSSTVHADEQALIQVLDNLVSNAVKYSPHGKRVFVRVVATDEKRVKNDQAASTQATNFIRIEIQDEGPGISADDMQKLFGKFARLSAQPTGGEHSTGLGLSIVKKLVEAMGGRVWCESELGKGATFVVELPAE